MRCTSCAETGHSDGASMLQQMIWQCMHISVKSFISQAITYSIDRRSSSWQMRAGSWTKPHCTIVAIDPFIHHGSPLPLEQDRRRYARHGSCDSEGCRVSSCRSLIQSKYFEDSCDHRHSEYTFQATEEDNIPGILSYDSSSIFLIQRYCLSEKGEEADEESDNCAKADPCFLHPSRSLCQNFYQCPTERNDSHGSKDSSADW